MMASRAAKRLFWLADANSVHTQRWIAALAQRGHDILLFSLTEPKPSVLTSTPNVRVETARFSNQLAYSAEGGLRKLLYAKSIPTVRSLLRSYRPDLSHAHYASSYGVVAMLAGLPRRILSVWGADVFNTPYRSFAHRFVISRAMRTAHLVLSTSVTMREHCRSICDREIEVVPFGIDLARFVSRREAGSDPRQLTIGTVKSLEDKYGIDVLLGAFQILLRTLPDARLRLLIVGGGSRRAMLQELAQQLGIAAQVEFTGPVEYARVPEMHDALDIAVFPSIEDSESFGVAVVEAQACARPVIVSRVGGLPEVVREDETGLVVPPGNPEALAEALRKLIGDRERARAMGRAGRRHVELHYDLARCVELLEGHYARLCA
jgi:glycosyltransferase involved in cell wall biosynthesis